MADQRLPQKTEKEVVSLQNIFHLVDIDDATDHTSGSSFKAKLLAILAHVTQNNDLVVPNGVIRGGLVPTGGMTETGWGTKYIINNQVYTTPVAEEVTHSNGDATHPRIDVTSIRVTATDPPVPSIEITEGTPAASPVKPVIDLLTDVELSFRIVAAGESSNPLPSNELIYDEFDEEPNEWDVTSTPTGADMEDTTDPKVNTKSITLPAYTLDTLEFTKATDYTYNATEQLVFYLRSTSGGTELRLPLAKINIKLIDSATGDYYLHGLNVNTFTDFGFQFGIQTWQLIQIPLSSFQSVGNSEFATYDTVEFEFVNTPALELDWIVLQTGVKQPDNPLRAAITYNAAVSFERHIQLTASEIKNIGTTPITVIPAPGVGNYVILDQLAIKFNWGSVAFDNNGIGLKVDGAAGNLSFATNILNATADVFTDGKIGSGSLSTIYVENAAVQIIGTDSVASGDSTMDFYITYQIKSTL